MRLLVSGPPSGAALYSLADHPLFGAFLLKWLLRK